MARVRPLSSKQTCVPAANRPSRSRRLFKMMQNACNWRKSNAVNSRDAGEKCNWLEEQGDTDLEIPEDVGHRKSRIAKARNYMRSLSRRTVNPSSSSYFKWLCIIHVPVMYNLVAIIARSVYSELQIKYRIAWMALDYVSDILYIIDLIVHFRTGYLEQGLLVTDTRRLVRRYVRSSQFSLDVLSVLPTEIFYVLWGADTAELRFNRLLKLTRVQEFHQKIVGKSSVPDLLRLCILVLNTIIIIHWNGCIYYALSGWLGFGTDSWVYPNVSDPIWGSLPRKYFFCFYWSTVTLINVGEPFEAGTDVELAFVIVNYLIGIIIFADIVGVVGNTIKNITRESAEFQHVMNAVKQYMKERSVGKTLELRVVRWFDYLRSNKQTLHGDAIMDVLPEKLRAEIAVHVHMDTLKKVTLFQDCEPGLLVEIAMKMRLQVFSPGDHICRRGDVGRDMYIVKKGVLSVVSDDGNKEFAQLKEGSVFGELSILNIAGNKTGNRRTANVRSVGYSDLFVLSKDSLWEVLHEYPEAKLALIEKGTLILKKDNLINESAAERQSQMPVSAEVKLKAVEETVKTLSARLSRLLENYASEQAKLKTRLKFLESLSATTTKRDH